MPEPRIGEVLVAIDREWRPFRALVSGLGPAAFERPTPAGWTAKEMLAHVAFWDEAIQGAVRTLFRGEPPSNFLFGSGYRGEADWPRDDEHNAREAAWGRGRTADEVVARVDRAHDTTIAFLAGVTDAEVAEHQAYFAGLGRHYAEHRPDLEALTRD